MGKSYPYVKRERFHPQGKKQLRLRCWKQGCQERITSKAVIEWIWFRREDSDTLYLCNIHGKKYRGKKSITNPDYVTDKELLDA